MSASTHLRAALDALLRNDTAERDRQCALAEEALAAEPHERAQATFYASGLPLLRACQDILTRAR